MQKSQLEKKTINPLVHRKTALADFIHSTLYFIDHQTPLYPQKTLADFRQQTPSYILEGKYGEAIFSLMEWKDLNQGIHWHVARSPLTNKDTIIRDARNCTLPTEAKESYLIMGLNNLRALRTLLPNYEEHKSYTELMIRNLYVFTRNDKNSVADVIKRLKVYNTVLVNILAIELKISFEEAYERIIIAKDFANLEDDARDIVTIAKLKDKSNKDVFSFQADFPICTLTAKIKEEYENCKNKVWYQALPNWKKDLIDHYAPLILTEKKVLPTQLRLVPLIGLRNWYEAINGLIYPTDYRLEVTSHAFHSGTFVTFGPDKEENKRITLLNTEQLKEVLQTNNIIALTLNSSINPTGHDSDIVKLTADATEKLNILHANLPLNFIRRISFNKTAAIITTLDLVARDIIPLIENYSKNNNITLLSTIQDYLQGKKVLLQFEEQELIVAFLKFSSTLNENKDEIEKLKELLDIVTLALNICFLMRNNKNLIDRENCNLDIGALLNCLISKIESYVSIAINSSCESGKDRDGILMFTTAIVSFIKTLFGSHQLSSPVLEEDQLIKNNIKILSIAGHLQTLPAFQGGSCGAYGIKPDSKAAMPLKFSDEVKNNLMAKTASYNKKIPLCSDKALPYFPIGNSEVKLHRIAIGDALSLQIKKINSKLLTKSFAYGSSEKTTSSKRKTILQEALKRIKELPEHCSLEDIKKIIDDATFKQKALTQGTVNGKGKTYKFLTTIATNVDEVITAKQEYVAKQSLRQN